MPTFYPVFLLLILFLQGCELGSSDPNILSALKTYHQRLLNIQDSTLNQMPIASMSSAPNDSNPLAPSAQEAALNPPQQLKLPSPKALTIPLTSQRISLLDSYQLTECQLFELIAEKNSSLGKFQDQFRELNFQLVLLKKLPHCLNLPNLEPDFKAQLQNIFLIKQKELPDRIENLIFTDQAMRKQLIANQWLTRKDAESLGHIHIALLELKRLKTPPVSTLRASTINLIDYQEVLEKAPVIGKLSFSMLNITHYLNQITHHLKRNDKRILCQKNRAKTDYERLNQVFQLFFIQKIQPYLAFVDQQYIALEDGLILLTKTTHGHHYPIHVLHKNFRTAIMQHVNYWQSLQQRCQSV